MTKQGVEVDACDSCGGVWLDRGEIYLFAKKPELVEGKLKEAVKEAAGKGKPTGRNCPKTGEPMMEIRYPGGPAIDACMKTGGLWFDKGELNELLGSEKQVRIDFDRKTAVPPPPPVIPSPPAPEPEPSAPPAAVSFRDRDRKTALAAGLLPLPNLALRSLTTLVGLYALLGLGLIIASETGYIGTGLAVGVGVAVVLLQFLAGPFIMDLSLRWLYRMEWVPVSGLPRHLQSFVEKTCGRERLTIPSFGVIEDGAPQAFTYGHTPNNARIVISRGLFDLLEPEEVEAVVAHEIGHAIHWDMLLMTVAQLVPLLLYYLYRALINTRRSDRESKGGGGQQIAIAIGAYVLYIVSQYVVLWFSRTREYFADRYAGDLSRNPSSLASALVKIAYGLAGRKKKEASKDEQERSAGLEAVGALGIFDAGAARSLAVASYGEGMAQGGVDKASLKGAMRWDLWNPWAKWYELNSTHPLVANRLLYLSDQAAHMGKAPYVVFDEVQPESYWDEFFVDFLVYILPTLVVLIFIGLAAATGLTGGAGNILELVGAGLLALGAAMLIRFKFVYAGGYFPAMSVAALLKKVKVSAVRPVPCRLEGTIIGKGVPGLIWSEDFVLQDETGIMFLDYRQPLGIFEFLFGLLRAGEYQGQQVVVEGWYRRSPMPFVEIKTMQRGGRVSTCYVSLYYKFMSFLMLLAGILILLAAQA